jgi:ferredoxin-NADP reductase
VCIILLQDWSQYQSAVLISAGIGVTPFASIIKHMHIRMQQCKALEQAGLQVEHPPYSAFTRCAVS